MIFVWGKRTYGSVNKVGSIAVKTVFGHLWYVPLFPMASYYVDTRSDAAYELKGINWRSVLCTYIRVICPIVLLFSVLTFQNHVKDDTDWVSGLLVLASAAAIIASYVLDKKHVDPQSVQVRQLMERYFDVAIDPFECATSLQMQIDARMRAGKPEGIDEHWYKRVLGDAFSPRESRDLALLRARCDQHDKALQESALRTLPPTARTA
ncbi:MAG: hypothetical protein ACJ8GW_09465 [Massilia sp.]